VPPINFDEVVAAIQERPIPCVLTLVGAFFGYLLSTTVVRVETLPSVTDPRAIASYVVGAPAAMVIYFVGALIGAAIGWLVGLLLERVMS